MRVIGRELLAVLGLGVLCAGLAWGEDGAGGIATRPEDAKGLAAGDAVPTLTLKTAAGEAFDLNAELKKQPALVIFYRGGWCPFCNKHLAEIQKIQADLKTAGFQILAVSPDAPEKTGETAQKGSLGYTLLSDADLAAAKAFKLAFRLDEGTIEKYKKYKIDLSASDWCLPVPAAYLVGSDGKVLFAHANPDYKVRIDNAKILEAAKAAQPAKAESHEAKTEEKTEGK